MGSYYAFGIVKDFKAESRQIISNDKLIEVLNERLDLMQYNIRFEGNVLRGELKNEVFLDNIKSFHDCLYYITNHKGDVTEFGTDIEAYHTSFTGITWRKQGITVNVRADFAILYMEGKVLVEEFDIEPLLINWLFRHANISNPLSGCIVSGIV